MCFHGKLEDTDFYRARNGSILGVVIDGSKITATVLKTTNRKYPIGHQVQLQSLMGHVLCKGSDGHCQMHDLDVTDGAYGKDAWALKQASNWKAESAVKEALRRRRYNIRRAARERDLLSV